MNEAPPKVLSTLEPGDTVAAITGYVGIISKSTVERVTKTQIVCNGQRWRKKDGRPVGSQGFDSRRLEPWHPRHELRYRQQQERREWEAGVHTLRTIDWADVPKEALPLLRTLVEVVTP